MLSSPNKELELVLKLNSCVIVLFVFYLFLSFTIICLWDCLSCKHVDASQRPHYMFGRLLQIDSMINMYDLEFPTLTYPTTSGTSPSHPILPCDYSRAITLPPHPPMWLLPGHHPPTPSSRAHPTWKQETELNTSIVLYCYVLITCRSSLPFIPKQSLQTDNESNIGLVQVYNRMLE